LKVLHTFPESVRFCLFRRKASDFVDGDSATPQLLSACQKHCLSSGSGVAVKVRQSASLVAGVCTLCVAASASITPVPATDAASPETTGPVVRPFELTAASDVLVGSSNVASLPLQNLITVLNALAGAAGGSNGTGGAGATSLQALANVLYSQLVAGTLTSASASTAINAALATEQTALTNLAATPGKILNTDLAALSALFGGSTTSQASIQPALNSAPFTQVGTVANVVDVINVASLPLQNGITALNALAGAAGGGNGTGGGGATSFQALPNLLYSQLVAGTLTEASATTAINGAVTTEQTALTNLAATPGKIIAADLAAIQKLAGDSASTLSPAKQQSDTPALKNSDVDVVASTIAGDEGPKNTTTGSTTRARHAAKAADNSPVSNAIKAIKEASKGSYVGKHRADTVGKKGASGSDENGSKGSTEK
jgi:hypothetical protein